MGLLHYRDPFTQLWVPLPMLPPLGPTGPTGAAGPEGFLGVTGPTGLLGPSGTVTGPTGPAGGVGPTGPAGSTGSIGPTGPVGDPGAKGPVGDTGIQGLQGPQGSVGPAGADSPYQFRVGTTTVTPTADTNTTGARVNFTAAYSSTPQLVVSMYSDAAGGTWRSVTHTGLDAAGFTPVVWRTNTINCIVAYLAVGIRSVARMFSAPMPIEGFDGYSGPVQMVQLPDGGFKTVAAFSHRILEVDGVLRLFNRQGAEIDQYGPGEYVSVASEVLTDGRLS